MKCLDDVALERLLVGTLHDDEMAQIDAHIDACAACFALVADILAIHSRGSSAPSLSDDVQNVARVAVNTWPSLGRRYVIAELIGRGGMGQVYRAFDRLTRTTVALKRIGVSQRHHGRAGKHDDWGSRTVLHTLAREFRTLATLRHPCIVSVFDHGFDLDREPYYTMELIEGAKPLLPLANSISFNTRIVLLGKLLDAIGYLHRRGVIHGDLKPSNILLTQDFDTPSLRIVDFGLSTTTTDEYRLEASGTVPYMAPEVLRGGASSEASDLYAVGVIACEMLAGHHPFRGANVTELVSSVLYEQPDLGAMPLSLARVIGRALSKSPEDRPVDSASFCREIMHAAGLNLKYDKVSARDAYLIAARFTGRATELAALAEALDDARAGRGSAWRVAGESGIGKSRLIDELRSIALSHGVLVVRGQAQEGGQSAFEVWRNALQVIALEMPIEDYEAAVLAAVVPNLELLLERAIQPSVDLPRARMMQVLVDILVRIGRPLLIVLEDLQWADAESVALLARMCSDVHSLPILIVASHRDDEAPLLPTELPLMRTLRLSRFNRAGIEALCVAMLGSAGRDTKLLDFVNKETEGNTYFVIEVFRALAERSGGLGDIDGDGLPERVFGGGIEQILWRRLSRVPTDAKDMLALVAVAGRQLDLRLLERIEPRIGRLIDVCAEAGVLETHEQQWQFHHDKLREKILGEIDDHTLRALHSKIAEGLEATYPGSVVHAAKLAHHLQRASHLAQAARAYAFAGEGALSRGAPGQAESLLDQARGLFEQVGATAEEQRRVWRSIALARFSLGKLGETDAALRRVCDLAGAPLPSNQWGLLRAMAREIGVFLGHRAGLRRQLQPDAQQADLLAGLSVQEIYVWLAKPELLTLCTLWGLNIEQTIDERQQHTHFRSAMAFLLANTPLRAAARRYLEGLSPSIHPESRMAPDHLRVMALVALHEGHWNDARDLAARSVVRARAQRDDLTVAHGLLQLQLAHIALDDFRGAEQAAMDLERLAVRLQHTRYEAMALSGQCTSRLRLGDVATARALIDRARGLIHHEIGPISESVIWGLSALCAFMQGEHEGAAAFARASMNAVELVSWPLQELRYALACVLDVWLGAPDPMLHELAIRRAIHRFREIGVRNRFALYVAMRFEGRFALHNGRVRLAAALIEESIRRADRVGARFDVAAGRFQLARVAESDEGRRYLPEGPAMNDRMALVLFEELGAAGEVAQVRAAIARYDRTAARRD